MALNPIVFTENVLHSFLRYQLTAYAFADDGLRAQMRELLSLDATRRSPLLKGPYVSLSRPFREGASVDALAAEGLLHPHMRQRIPAEITHLYGHQEEAIRAIRGGHTTLVSTGTGSGKTECFLYPVIVYPMNALAEDQLMRLRSLLAGTGITFGMYVGKTPERENEVAGIRLPAGTSRADYEAKLAKVRVERPGETLHPAEEVCAREAMRTPGGQPRILLTSVKQLEQLLTRQRDAELFAGARLDYLVFDEAHTFTGAQGAETACLIRRLRSFCGRSARDTVCVATSATMVDYLCRLKLRRASSVTHSMSFMRSGCGSSRTSAAHCAPGCSSPGSWGDRWNPGSPTARSACSRRRWLGRGRGEWSWSSCAIPSTPTPGSATR